MPGPARAAAPLIAYGMYLGRVRPSTPTPPPWTPGQTQQPERELGAQAAIQYARAVEAHRPGERHGDGTGYAQPDRDADTHLFTEVTRHDGLECWGPCDGCGGDAVWLTKPGLDTSKRPALTIICPRCGAASSGLRAD